MARKLAEAEGQRAADQSRAAKRLRQRALLLAGALLVAGVLAVVALVFGQQAGRNARLALAEADTRATAEAGAFVRALAGHDGPVWSASFSPDGRQVATDGFDGTVRLWNLDGTPDRSLRSALAPMGHSWRRPVTTVPPGYGA